MAATSILLGAVLTFSSTSGRDLQLAVMLTESATVSLSWGDTISTRDSADHHLFTNLLAPRAAPLIYELRVAGGETVRQEIPAIPEQGPIRVALYGDSRDGSGPHEVLVEQISNADPQILVHTGDVIHRANDQDSWARHLAASLPVSMRVPTIFALGNHELIGDRAGGTAQAMARIPPPKDPLAESLGVAPESFHVRIGSTLFIVLNSNEPMGSGSAELEFFQRVLEKESDATLKFAALHHGPLSSGRHGGHREGDVIFDAARRHGLTAFLAGHDHTYERIERDGIMVLVSGGGGAPLYDRSRIVAGSKAFASSYNWVRLDIDGPKGVLRAFSLEGVLLDQAIFPSSAQDAPEDGSKTPSFMQEPLLFARLILPAAILVLLATLVVGARFLARRKGSRIDPSEPS